MAMTLDDFLRYAEAHLILFSFVLMGLLAGLCCITSGGPNARLFGWLLVYGFGLFITVGVARFAWGMWG